MAIDLDAQRASRSGDEPVEVTFGGETFYVPRTPPLDVIDLFNKQDAVGAFHALLGDQWERFSAHRPDVKDMAALAKGYAEEAGFSDVGESSASSPSSRSTSRRSRPTSPASTPAAISEASTAAS